MSRTKAGILAGCDYVTARTIANNTWEWVDAQGVKRIRLHRTDIITYLQGGSVILNSGRYRTTTTKARLNAAGFDVRTERGVWYVIVFGVATRYRFEDGMCIDVAGKVTGAEEYTGFTKRDKNNYKHIKEYVAGFMAELEAGEVNAPGAGDCWYCHLRSADGVPMGEQYQDISHIQDHIRIKYYVPSLLFRACEVFGVSRYARDVLGFWTGQHNSPPHVGMLDVARRQVSKALSRYLKRQLGYAV